MTVDHDPRRPAPALAGRTILVTRRRAQASKLTAVLTELGATVVEIPAIETIPPEDAGPLDRALRQLAAFDWVIFTSANAVRFTRERCDAMGARPDALLQGPGLAVVGPSTAAALGECFPGAAPTLAPDKDFRAEGLIEAFASLEVADLRVLLPSAEHARDVLPRALLARGAQVEVVIAYRTVAPPDLGEILAARLTQGFDLALFASPSAVENFTTAAGPRVRGLRVAVMGPVTEAAAREAGMDVRAVASPSTVDGLILAAIRALPSS